MKGDKKIYKTLDDLNIKYEYYEHPPIPTIELAKIHKKNINATHCKNIFLRNHKGNKHFFVVVEQNYEVNIRKLELLLKQGKLSFASEKRLTKYLNVKQGAVSPLGLIYDTENNTHVFIDKNLEKSEKLSFHPNVSDASLVIKTKDLLKYLKYCGNSFEFIELEV